MKLREKPWSRIFLSISTLVFFFSLSDAVRTFLSNSPHVNPHFSSIFPQSSFLDLLTHFHRSLLTQNLSRTTLYLYNPEIQNKFLIPFWHHLRYPEHLPHSRHHRSILLKLSPLQKELLLFGTPHHTPICDEVILTHKPTRKILLTLLSSLPSLSPIIYQVCSIHSTSPNTPIFYILRIYFPLLWRQHLISSYVPNPVFTQENLLHHMAKQNSLNSGSHLPVTMSFVRSVYPPYKALESQDMVISFHRSFPLLNVFYHKLESLESNMRHVLEGEGSQCIFQETTTGMTPLFYALVLPNDEAKDLFFEYAACKNIFNVSDHHGDTALVYMMKHSKYLGKMEFPDNRLAVTMRYTRRIIEETNFDIEAINKEKKKLFHYTIETNITPLVELVLSYYKFNSQRWLEALEYAIAKEAHNSARYILSQLPESIFEEAKSRSSNYMISTSRTLSSIRSTHELNEVVLNFPLSMGDDYIDRCSLLDNYILNHHFELLVFYMNNYKFLCQERKGPYGPLSYAILNKSLTATFILLKRGFQINQPFGMASYISHIFPVKSFALLKLILEFGTIRFTLNELVSDKSSSSNAVFYTTAKEYLALNYSSKAVKYVEKYIKRLGGEQAISEARLASSAFAQENKHPLDYYTTEKDLSNRRLLYNIIDAQDSEGMSRLSQALKNLKTMDWESFFQTNADPDVLFQQGNDSQTLLQKYSSNPEVVKNLLRLGANPNVLLPEAQVGPNLKEGIVAIIATLFNYNSGIIEDALDSGLILSLTNDYGNNMLMVTVCAPYINYYGVSNRTLLNMIKWFKDIDAFNGEGKTFLRCLIDKGVDISILSFLKRHNYDLIQPIFGKTSLYYARRHEYESAVSLLLSLGVDPRYGDHDDNIELYESMYLESQEYCLRYTAHLKLINKPSQAALANDVKTLERYKRIHRTAVFLAIEQKKPDCAVNLLSILDDINIFNEKGFSLLSEFIRHGAITLPHIMTALSSFPFDKSIQNKGTLDTPLHFIVSDVHIDILNFLLAQPEKKKNKNNRRPLQLDDTQSYSARPVTPRAPKNQVIESESSLFIRSSSLTLQLQGSTSQPSKEMKKTDKSLQLAKTAFIANPLLENRKGIFPLQNALYTCQSCIKKYLLHLESYQISMHGKIDRVLSTAMKKEEYVTIYYILSKYGGPTDLSPTAAQAELASILESTPSTAIVNSHDDHIPEHTPPNDYQFSSDENREKVSGSFPPLILSHRFDVDEHSSAYDSSESSSGPYAPDSSAVEAYESNGSQSEESPLTSTLSFLREEILIRQNASSSPNLPGVGIRPELRMFSQDPDSPDNGDQSILACLSIKKMGKFCELLFYHHRNFPFNQEHYDIYFFYFLTAAQNNNISALRALIRHSIHRMWENRGEDEILSDSSEENLPQDQVIDSPNWANSKDKMRILIAAATWPTNRHIAPHKTAIHYLLTQVKSFSPRGIHSQVRIYPGNDLLKALTKSNKCETIHRIDYWNEITNLKDQEVASNILSNIINHCPSSLPFFLHDIHFNIKSSHPLLIEAYSVAIKTRDPALWCHLKAFSVPFFFPPNKYKNRLQLLTLIDSREKEWIDDIILGIRCPSCPSTNAIPSPSIPSLEQTSLTEHALDEALARLIDHNLHVSYLDRMTSFLCPKQIVRLCAISSLERLIRFSHFPDLDKMIYLGFKFHAEPLPSRPINYLSESFASTRVSHNALASFVSSYLGKPKRYRKLIPLVAKTNPYWTTNGLTDREVEETFMRIIKSFLSIEDKMGIFSLLLPRGFECNAVNCGRLLVTLFRTNSMDLVKTFVDHWKFKQHGDAVLLILQHIMRDIKESAEDVIEGRGKEDWLMLLKQFSPLFLRFSPSEGERIFFGFDELLVASLDKNHAIFYINFVMEELERNLSLISLAEGTSSVISPILNEISPFVNDSPKKDVPISSSIKDIPPVRLQESDALKTAPGHSIDFWQHIYATCSLLRHYVENECDNCFIALDSIIKSKQTHDCIVQTPFDESMEMQNELLVIFAYRYHPSMVRYVIQYTVNFDYVDSSSPYPAVFYFFGGGEGRDQKSVYSTRGHSATESNNPSLGDMSEGGEEERVFVETNAEESSDSSLDNSKEYSSEEIKKMGSLVRINDGTFVSEGEFKYLLLLSTTHLNLVVGMQSLLSLAAREDDVQAIEYLLQVGVECRSVIENGDNVLFTAVRHASWSVLRYFLNTPCRLPSYLQKEPVKSTIAIYDPAGLTSTAEEGNEGEAEKSNGNLQVSVQDVDGINTALRGVTSPIEASDKDNSRASSRSSVNGDFNNRGREQDEVEDALIEQEGNGEELRESEATEEKLIDVSPWNNNSSQYTPAPFDKEDSQPNTNEEPSDEEDILDTYKLSSPSSSTHFHMNFNSINKKTGDHLISVLVAHEELDYKVLLEILQSPFCYSKYHTQSPLRPSPSESYKRPNHYHSTFSRISYCVDLDYKNIVTGDPILGRAVRKLRYKNLRVLSQDEEFSPIFAPFWKDCNVLNGDTLFMTYLTSMEEYDPVNWSFLYKAQLHCLTGENALFFLVSQFLEEHLPAVIDNFRLLYEQGQVLYEAALKRTALLEKGRDLSENDIDEEKSDDDDRQHSRSLPSSPHSGGIRRRDNDMQLFLRDSPIILRSGATLSSPLLVDVSRSHNILDSPSVLPRAERTKGHYRSFPKQSLNLQSYANGEESVREEDIEDNTFLHYSINWTPSTKDNILIYASQVDNINAVFLLLTQKPLRLDLNYVHEINGNPTIYYIMALEDSAVLTTYLSLVQRHPMPFIEKPFRSFYHHKEDDETLLLAASLINTELIFDQIFQLFPGDINYQSSVTGETALMRLAYRCKEDALLTLLAQDNIKTSIINPKKGYNALILLLSGYCSEKITVSQHSVLIDKMLDVAKSNGEELSLVSHINPFTGKNIFFYLVNLPLEDFDLFKRLAETYLSEDNRVNPMNGRSLLMEAMDRQNYQVAQYLIEKFPMDVNYQNPKERGCTALFLEVMHLRFAGVKFLLLHGADRTLGIRMITESPQDRSERHTTPIEGVTLSVGRTDREEELNEESPSLTLRESLNHLKDSTLSEELDEKQGGTLQEIMEFKTEKTSNPVEEKVVTSGPIEEKFVTSGPIEEKFVREGPVEEKFVREKGYFTPEDWLNGICFEEVESERTHLARFILYYMKNGDYQTVVTSDNKK